MQQYAIKELRRLLVNEDEFEITKDYFFDWVKEHEKTAFNTRTKNKALTKLLNVGLSDAFKKEISVQNIQMFEVKNIYFMHGMGSFERGNASFFYFSDIDWGMIVGVTPELCRLTRFRMIAHEKLDFSTEGQEN